MGKGTGLIYIVAGGQDVGKSQYVISQIKKSKRHVFVFDRRREYLERYGKRNITIFTDRKQFIDNLPKFYNANVIFEEGTAFLTPSKNFDIADLLIGAFHQGNIIYILVHSICDIPRYVLRLSHVLVLFATGDDPHDVKQLRRSLLPYLHQNKTPKFIRLQPF